MADRYIDKISSKEIARFWLKVDKRGPDECWPWLGAKRSSGHGTSYAGDKVVCATHIALTLAGDQRPQYPRNFALHSCDNPVCVNPTHLRWGTPMNNVEDRMQHGNHLVGSSIHNSVLTPSDVRFIRSSNEARPVLAKQFGVSQTAIRDVVQRKTWKSVC